jgi:hypothetical protein
LHVVTEFYEQPIYRECQMKAMQLAVQFRSLSFFGCDSHANLVDCLCLDNIILDFFLAVSK